MITAVILLKMNFFGHHRGLIEHTFDEYDKDEIPNGSVHESEKNTDVERYFL